MRLLLRSSGDKTVTLLLESEYEQQLLAACLALPRESAASWVPKPLNPLRVSSCPR